MWVKAEKRFTAEGLPTIISGHVRIEVKTEAQRRL